MIILDNHIIKKCFFIVIDRQPSIGEGCLFFYINHRFTEKNERRKIMRKFPKMVLIAVGIIIACLSFAIMSFVELGEFEEAFRLIPLLVGCSTGFHQIKKKENAIELDKLIAIAYERAIQDGVEYADDDYVISSCLTRQEQIRYRTLKGEYPYASR